MIEIHCSLETQGNKVTHNRVQDELRLTTGLHRASGIGEVVDVR